MRQSQRRAYNARPTGAGDARQRIAQAVSPAQELQALQAAFDLTADAIVFLEWPGLTVTHANRAACQMLQYAPGELAGKPWAEIDASSSAAPRESSRGAALGGGGACIPQATHLTRRDQTRLPVELVLTPPTSDRGGVLVVVARPASDERLERQSVHEALHDALTGLPNRRLLLKRLELALQPQRPPGEDCALLFIDLDHFKAVNDTWGHMQGDHVLRTVAQRLTSSVRPSDLVARFGGDEFVVLVEQVRGRREVLKIARRIQRAMQAPIETARRPLTISASIGIVLDSDRHTTLERFIHAADQAMYHAKSLGRTGNFVFHRVSSDEEPTSPDPWAA